MSMTLLLPGAPLAGIPAIVQKKLLAGLAAVVRLRGYRIEIESENWRRVAGVTQLTVLRRGIAHDGGGCRASESCRRTVMDQATRLKWAAVAFTIFWIGGMLWWSGEYHPANIVILSVCGTVGGYLWYLAMRWVFQGMRLLNGDRGAGQERAR
jgi:hypothetical protein